MSYLGKGGASRLKDYFILVKSRISFMLAIVLKGSGLLGTAIRYENYTYCLTRSGMQT